ncbi:MAG: hypothetical protein EBR32_01665 [Bacteroidetes bacterium]|nr:hypothetical protein [Bacteroidota bacterium]
MTKSELHIIGRLERINIPNWDLIGLEAKVDTGAYSSSIHCNHIHAFEKNGQQWVRFQLLDPEHSAYNHKIFEVPISDVRDVKSSNGSVESRFFVSTVIELNDQTIETELSLTDRSEMKYPVLLGRKFLLNRFLVDVSRSNVV